MPYFPQVPIRVELETTPCLLLSSCHLSPQTYLYARPRARRCMLCFIHCGVFSLSSSVLPADCARIYSNEKNPAGKSPPFPTGWRGAVPHSFVCGELDRPPNRAPTVLKGGPRISRAPCRVWRPAVRCASRETRSRAFFGDCLRPERLFGALFSPGRVPLPAASSCEVWRPAVRCASRETRLSGTVV